MKDENRRMERSEEKQFSTYGVVKSVDEKKALNENLLSREIKWKTLVWQMKLIS